MRGDFIKEHGFHRCTRIGLFTDRLLLRRIQRRGFDAPSARRMGTDSSHAEIVSMRARLRHVPKGQKFIAQGKRSDTLGYGGRWAFSPHSLTFNTATLTRANYFPYLLTRLLSREPAPFLPNPPTCPSKTQCPFNTLHPSLNNSHSTPNIPHSTSNPQHPSLNNSHPTPNIPHPTPNIQHSTFNTQHSTFHIIKCWG